MRKLLIVSVAVAIFVGCSAPKYTYYFDRYPSKNLASAKSEDVSVEYEHLTSDVITQSSSAPAQDRILLAGTSKNFSPKSGNGNSLIIISKNSKATLLKATIQDRSGLINAAKEFKAKKKSPNAIQEGDKNKNDFASAGFVLSLLGLFFLWPLCILGFILSAAGLKSKRRGLAMAGFIIGIIGTIIVWLATSTDAPSVIKLL